MTETAADGVEWYALLCKQTGVGVPENVGSDMLVQDSLGGGLEFMLEPVIREPFSVPVEDEVVQP